jgi:hypothetical protein
MSNAFVALVLCIGIAHSATLSTDTRPQNGMNTMFLCIYCGGYVHRRYYNCCVWPHFVPNCDLFRIPHQQDISDAMQPSSSLSTHPMIHLTSMNHSVCVGKRRQRHPSYLFC